MAYFRLDQHAEAEDMFRRLRENSESTPFLESWEYVRSVRNERTRFFGTKFQLLTHALDQAQSDPDSLVCEFGVRFGPGEVAAL